jgi:hypothetical protein
MMVGLNRFVRVYSLCPFQSARYGQNDTKHQSFHSTYLLKPIPLSIKQKLLNILNVQQCPFYSDLMRQSCSHFVTCR